MKSNGKNCIPPSSIFTLEQIKEAQNVLSQSSLIRRTPLCSGFHRFSPSLAETGAELFFKLECLQTEGSFKTRGVIYMLNNLTSDKKQRGLVSMSGGNFARSLSYVCGQSDVPCTVIMPKSAPKDRSQICSSYGAQVELVDRVHLQERVDAIVSQEKRHYAHPFDDPDLMRGYGCIGLEILEDMQHCILSSSPSSSSTCHHFNSNNNNNNNSDNNHQTIKSIPDIIVIGIGGGGLISGISGAIRLMLKDNGIDPNSVRIVGVEPEGAPSMYQSLREGKAVTLSSINTFVNGLAPPFAGQNALEVIRNTVDEVVLVSDDEVKHAMNVLFTETKLVVENAGAACVAALLSGRLGDVRGQRVVCVLSGGNVSPEDMVSALSS